jgi:hypothetical protein
MIRSRPFGNATGSAARIAPSRRSEQLALVLLEIELSQEHISHTETSSYLRNLAVPRGFERPSCVTRWRPDWLAEAAGFEPLHLQIRSAELRGSGRRSDAREKCGSRTCHPRCASSSPVRQAESLGEFRSKMQRFESCRLTRTQGFPPRQTRDRSGPTSPAGRALLARPRLPDRIGRDVGAVVVEKLDLDVAARVATTNLAPLLMARSSAALDHSGRATPGCGP